MLKKNLGKLSAALLSAALLLNLSSVSLAVGADFENTDSAPEQVQASHIQESTTPSDVVIPDGEDADTDVLPEEGESLGTISITVDGEEYAPVSYVNGTASVLVDAGDKTILSVTVDGETVVDHSYVPGDGSELPGSYEHSFDDGADHTVVITQGYKVVVTTYYVEQDKAGETYWSKGSTVDAMIEKSVATPTTATYVVAPGKQAQAIKLLPTENAAEGFPFERLDYIGHTSKKLGASPFYKDNKLVVPGSGQLGSDWDTYYTSSAEPGAGQGTSRFMLLGNMPAEDCTLAYAYNYHRVGLFANYTFELVDGTLQAEQYVNPAPSAPMYTNYHSYDTAADGSNAYAFGGLTGNSAVFGDIVFPEGTTADNYVLKQSALGADYFTTAFANKEYYQWLYSAGWSSDQNAASTARVLADTGLTLDYSTGLYSGTLTTRLASRNYISFQTFSLIRPVVYHANDGTEQPQTGSLSAVKDQVITVADNSFVRDGYSFTGWNTMADGSGDSFAPDATLTVGAVAQVDLYAQWEKISPPPETTTYKLTVNYVDENGETLAPAYTTRKNALSRYDLTERTEKTIAGYIVDRVEGDVIGTVRGAVTVTVYYAEEADIPPVEPPLTDLPEVDAPETDAPETDAPEVDISEENVPLAPLPEGDVEITDPETPLGNLPQTGTNAVSVNPLSAIAAVCAVLSVVTAAIGILLRKKESI